MLVPSVHQQWFAVERVLGDAEAAQWIQHVALRYFNAAGADPDGELRSRRAPRSKSRSLRIVKFTTEFPLGWGGGKWSSRKSRRRLAQMQNRERATRPSTFMMLGTVRRYRATDPEAQTIAPGSRDAPPWRVGRIATPQSRATTIDGHSPVIV
jgi:hypothetical protein